MHFSQAAVFLTTFLLVSGCAGSGHLTPDLLRKAVYQMPGVGKFTFTDGAYYPAATDTTGHAFARMGLVDLFAFGDLNDDGAEDAVTFVVSYGRDSRILLSMEVLLNEDGSPSHTASYLIGDRVAIDLVEIVSGNINLNIITQGPNDSICCPTLHVSKTLQLHNGELTESKPVQ